MFLGPGRTQPECSRHGHLPLWGQGSCRFPAPSQLLRPRSAGVSRGARLPRRGPEGDVIVCAKSASFYFFTWCSCSDRKATRVGTEGGWDLTTTDRPKRSTEHTASKAKGMEKHLPGKNICLGNLPGLFLLPLGLQGVVVVVDFARTRETITVLVTIWLGL